MNSNNKPKVTVKELVEILTNSFKNAFNSNKVTSHPSIFLEGSPGLGKSQGVYQLKERLELLTKRKVNIIDIRLLLFNPVDLRGLPVVNKEKNAAIWLVPQILKETNEADINILFLDELTSAPKSLQAAAYQLALDKRIGEHKLPNNTFVIAAGNKKSDNALTYDMPSALENRFINFEVISDINSWFIWAKENNINKEIISFLEKYPEMLNTENYQSDNLIITPRSWEMLSDLLEFNNTSIELSETLASSVVGVSMVELMLNKRKVYRYQDVINKKIDKYPNNLEELEQTTSMLVEMVSDYKSDINKINTILEFILNLPVDFAIRVFRALSKDLDDEIDTDDIPLYSEFINKVSKNV